jgi:glycosyltransferase involved in cell wall biosynthesis
MSDQQTPMSADKKTIITVISALEKQSTKHDQLKSNQPLISIIVPVYNEEDVLTEFHQAVDTALSTLPIDLEIVYINDGSSDNTLEVINALRASDKRITLIDLSRNFGKEVALSAGLHKAAGMRL